MILATFRHACVNLGASNLLRGDRGDALRNLVRNIDHRQIKIMLPNRILNNFNRCQLTSQFDYWLSLKHGILKINVSHYHENGKQVNKW